MRRYEDPDWCRTQYEGGATYREMAESADCSLRTIARWMKLHGIEVPKAAHKRQQRGTFPPINLAPLTCLCGARKSRTAVTCMACRDVTTDRNPKWRGDDVGNRSAHQRVMALHGKATSYLCQHCRGPAAHWAYDHEDAAERPSNDGPYSTKTEHYIPLCVPCHKRFDLDYLQGVAR